MRILFFGAVAAWAFGMSVRKRTTPAIFIDGKHVVDLGKIVLGEGCDGCKTGLCVVPKVEANLTAK